MSTINCNLVATNGVGPDWRIVAALRDDTLHWEWFIDDPRALARARDIGGTVTTVTGPATSMMELPDDRCYVRVLYARLTRKPSPQRPRLTPHKMRVGA